MKKFLLCLYVAIPNLANAFCELPEPQVVDVTMTGKLLFETFKIFVLLAGPILVLFTIFRIIQHWKHPVKYKKPTIFIYLLAVLFAVYVVFRVFEFFAPQCFVGV